MPNAPLPARRVEMPALPESYVVVSGDTVFGISRRYAVPLRDLIEINRLLPPYHVRVGQRLVFPVRRTHTVAAGDTVYSISRRYAVDMSQLVKANEIAPPYTITVGQSLALPANQPTIATAPAAEPAPVESAPAAPEKTTAAPAEPVTAPATTGQSVSGGETASRTPSLPQGPATKQTVSLPRIAIPSPPKRSGGKFLWPVSGRVISSFGPKNDGLHNDGLNIAAPRGAAVLASENGVVAYAGSELKGFGNLLLLKHADGWVTAYAHNETVLVQRGDIVQRGQVIARVGSTGNVSSPQLHFEVRKGTRAVDPRQLLGAQSTSG